MLKTLVFIAFLVVHIQLMGQTKDSSLIAFNAEQRDNYIRIDFTIKAGNQCQGVVLEHSTDSVNLQPIYKFPGICGAADKNESYSYNHYYPKSNSNNYYRLNLGGTGYSSVITTLYVNYGKSNYIIYPMPVISESKLYFKNNTYKKFRIEITNMEGKQIIIKDVATINAIEIGKLATKAGMYLFRLSTDGGLTITGNFIIL